MTARAANRFAERHLFPLLESKGCCHEYVVHLGCGDGRLLAAMVASRPDLSYTGVELGAEEAASWLGEDAEVIDADPADFAMVFDAPVTAVAVGEVGRCSEIVVAAAEWLPRGSSVYVLLEKSSRKAEPRSEHFLCTPRCYSLEVASEARFFRSPTRSAAPGLRAPAFVPEWAVDAAERLLVVAE